MNIKTEILHQHDRLRYCDGATDEVTALCKERGVEETFRGSCKAGQEEMYLAIVKETLAKHHTTQKFKVGDKVYVHSGAPTVFENYIRATVTEISTDGSGYHLRAFKQDLPGIFLFNIWDKDLLSRTDKSNKPIPVKDRLTSS